MVLGFFMYGLKGPEAMFSEQDSMHSETSRVLVCVCVCVWEGGLQTFKILIIFILSITFLPVPLPF